MKIILINNLYAPWVRGGAERIVEKTAEGLEKAGHDVFVIATAPKESHTDRVYYLPSIFYNLEKYSLATRFFWHLFDIFNFSHANKVKKILEEKNPDLVVTHNLQGVSCLIPWLLRRMKIKHFHTLHDIQLLHPSGLMFWGKEKLLNSMPAKIYQGLMRFLFGSPAVVISPSQWLLAEHEKRSFFKNSKKTILPNYFSEQRLAESAKCKVQNTKYQFLYVGQIEKHKGVEFLVETFLTFLEKNPQAKLNIVGAGSQLEEIKKMASGKEGIMILGRKNVSEVADLMSSANFLIVPSLCYENSPTVIYEAFGCGLPVLGANLGGIPELIATFGGIVFKPGDKEDLLKKMEEIAANPAKQAEISAKEKPFQTANYIEELVDLAKQ